MHSKSMGAFLCDALNVAILIFFIVTLLMLKINQFITKNPYVEMVGEVVIVLQPFLSFSIAFDKGMAHNMLTLMLDPKYRGM
jgi:hypothetical protein